MNNKQTFSAQAGKKYTRFILLCYVIIVNFIPVCFSQQFDIALKKSSPNNVEKIGDAVEIITEVSNSGKKTARKLKIHDQIPKNAKYVAAFPANLYDPTTNTWEIDSIAAKQTIRLSLVLRLLEEGVVYQQAELIDAQELDEDSTPQNQDITEDDWAATCLSVPMLYLDKSKIDIFAAAPEGWLHYRWFKNGEEVAQTRTLTIKDFGQYHYEVSNDATTCENGYSCPILVQYGEPIIKDEPIAQTQNDLILYPNPTEELLNVAWKENINFQHAQATVVDMFGRMIYQQSVDNQLFQINISEWPSGMYKLILQTDRGNYYQDNFVVLK